MLINTNTQHYNIYQTIPKYTYSYIQILKNNIVRNSLLRYSANTHKHTHTHTHTL